MLFIGIISYSEAQVAINEQGNDPHESAMLDVSSFDKGLLIPRLSSVQRQQIENPANGLMVFDITTDTFWFYSDATGEWEEMGGAIVNVLNDLMDAKTDANSIYIGFQSGVNNDGNNANTALGSKSMKDNTAGHHNTALGYTSLNNSTSGSNNVAIGDYTLGASVSGNQNTAIGSAAGSSIGEDASGNVFIGYEAGKLEEGSNRLYIENSGSQTPLIGGNFETDEVTINGNLNISENLQVTENISTESLKITGGEIAEGKILTSDAEGNAFWQNPTAGVESLNDLIDAATTTSSLYIGESSGENDEESQYNVAIGKLTMQANTTGKSNAALGYGALANNTTGEGNTAIGSASMATNQTGSDNLAIGQTTLAFNNGSNNTAVGNRSLLMNTGSENTALGQGAGQNSDNSSGNVFLGYNAGKEETASNKLYIENSESSTPLIKGDFDTDEVDIYGDFDVHGSTYTFGNAAIGVDLNIGRNINVDDTVKTKYIKISEGNPAAGKVLTSDENGIASWSDEAMGANEINDLTDASTEGGNLYLGKYAGELSSGSVNIAIGDNALNNHEASVNNIAIGHYAGENDSPTQGSNNIFIGNFAGIENEGSNQLIIETNSVGAPLIYGNFDEDHLQINGTLEITGGNPGEGKVLVSDADGKASWDYAAGAQSINQLTDGKTLGKSLYLGEESGDHEIEETESTGVGYQSLLNNSGFYNNAFGYGSMFSNTDGFDNTAFGRISMSNNTTGDRNVGIGNGTLNLNKTGDNNTAIGAYAGANTPDDISGSVFIGQSAGYNATESNQLYIENSSSETPLIGGDFSTDEVVINGTLQITGGNPDAGKVLVSDSEGKASWSSSAGANSINDLTDAKNDNSSIYLGSPAGADDGNNKNTATGIQTLSANTSGQYNAAFGYKSLNANNEGHFNSAFGYAAMELSTNGSENTAFGSGALYNNGEGTQNTAIGFEAGFGTYGYNSTGNVFLGYKAGYYETGSNKLYISNSDTYYPLVYGDFDQNMLEVNGEFKVADGAYNNVKINNENLESNVPINVNSSVHIDQTLDVDGEITANEKIIANEQIEAHEDIILSEEKNIKYENARTAKLNYAGSEFFWSTYEDDDYSYDFYHEGTTLALTTQPYSGRVYFRLSKQIQLPEGAKITNIKFSFGGGPDDEVQIQVIKRSFEQTYIEGEELFESTFHFGEGEWTTYEFGFGVDPIIDNDYIYQICLRAQVNDNDDGFGGIFGLNTVSIEYEYETLNH